MLSTKRPVAFITGITGQDGSYLAELLLEKGYEVHGLKRRSSSFNTRRIDHLTNDASLPIYLHYGDMTDSTSIIKILQDSSPDEVYNLAAQSHVQVSFETPEYTANCDANGALRLLESLRSLGFDHVKYYQASTSELYGTNCDIPQDESTPFHPCSPYAIAKLYAFWTTVNFRSSYGMFASNGILFNHESPRRSGNFVTRKITSAFARIQLGLQDHLSLGNLNSLRDWGHASDYVKAMWLILQHHQPSDFVIATGRQETIRTFCELTSRALGWGGITWEGEGVSEVGRRNDTGKLVVKVDPKYFRPTEVSSLLGNPNKAKELLGWQPSISLEELIDEMLRVDLALSREERNLASSKLNHSRL